MKFFRARHVSMATLRNSFDRRSIVIGSVQGGIGALLAGRLGYLAIAQNEKYKLESESNRVNLSLIPPRRGWILDRHALPLASNRADFRVDIIPERMTGGAETIGELTKLLRLTPVQVRDLQDKLERSHGFAPVEVASGLDWDRFAAVSVRLPDTIKAFIAGICQQATSASVNPSEPPGISISVSNRAISGCRRRMDKASVEFDASKTV